MSVHTQHSAERHTYKPLLPSTMPSPSVPTPTMSTPAAPPKRGRVHKRTRKRKIQPPKGIVIDNCETQQLYNNNTSNHCVRWNGFLLLGYDGIYVWFEHFSHQLSMVGCVCHIYCRICCFGPNITVFGVILCANK